ncbi:MAG: hypothetical protein ACRCY7_07620 [Cetobacterium sp.]|uniref:hypothetical protein n=1 Tax=Cetobacterium sp. TaxID=2071632 RepID=UPI003F2DF0B4
MTDAKKLKQIYGDRNIMLLHRFTEGEYEYLRDQSLSIFKEMQVVEKIRDRNKKNIYQTKMKNMIKLFFKEVFDNLICSPNLIAFYSGIEIDLLASKYIGIDTSFDIAAKNHSEKAGRDYTTLLTDLRDCVKLELNVTPIYSDDLKAAWIKTSKYLGNMLIRAYKYNEFIYNQDKLIEDLDRIDLEYYNRSKDEITWSKQDTKEEIAVWNELYSRVLIMDEYFNKHKQEMERLFPDEAKADIRYIKTTITKLKNVLELTKVEIENRKPPKVTNKLQKYVGMNLKHWKSMEAR